MKTIRKIEVLNKLNKIKSEVIRSNMYNRKMKNWKTNTKVVQAYSSNERRHKTVKVIWETETRKKRGKGMPKSENTKRNNGEK